MKWAAAVIALLAIVLFAWVALGKGVKVEIQNVSGVAFTNVRLQVKNHKPTIGDIAAGESDSVQVEPNAATDEVRVWWTTPDGKEQFGRVPVSIDPDGAHGTITIQVGEKTIQGSEIDVDHGFF